MPTRYEQMTEALRDRLSEPSFQHGVRVAETAKDLATLYGVDVDDAQVAGLLHDWDRELGHGDLLSAAERHGLPITDDDEASPYLVHARTGAAAVTEAFPGVSGEVADAISRHTVGAPTMNDLDMVVYVADMIEPQRRYDGVEVLREAVGTVGLRELFALCYQQSMGYLVRERRRIHPDSVAVWNALVARGQR